MFMHYAKRFTWLGTMLKPFLGKAGLLNFKFDSMGTNLLYQDYLERDPFYYKGKMKLGTGMEIRKAARSVMRNAGKVTVPYIMYHGNDDQIVFSLYRDVPIVVDMEGGEVQQKDREQGQVLHSDPRYRLCGGE